jgi:xylulokinase
MPLVAGVDSSTQSTKVELRDLSTGQVIGAGRADHPMVQPPRSEQAPEAWWAALVEAMAIAVESAGPKARPTDVIAIAVAAQQHGMVTLDRQGDVLRPGGCRPTCRPVRRGELGQGLRERSGGGLHRHQAGLAPPV